MSYVLIEADEGTTADVFLAPSLDALCTVVAESHARAVETLPAWNAADQTYLPARCRAILALLAAAASLAPGRHVLTNGQGLWTAWTLIIPSSPTSSAAFLA